MNRTGMQTNTADISFIFRILLLGKTGSGKSSTGNTILGYHWFDVGPSFGLVTKRSQSQSVTVNGRSFEVTDTPGLFDLQRTTEEAAAVIRQTLATALPGPHVVLYVIRSDRRFTEEQLYDYKAAMRLFTEDVKKHLIIVFVGGPGDKMHDERLESELEDTPEGLQTMLRDCENRYVTIDNCANNKEFQVDRLFTEIQSLIAANGGKHFSMDAVNEADQQEMIHRLNKIFNQLDDYEAREA